MHQIRQDRTFTALNYRMDPFATKTVGTLLGMCGCRLSYGKMTRQETRPTDESGVADEQDDGCWSLHAALPSSVLVAHGRVWCSRAPSVALSRGLSGLAAAGVARRRLLGFTEQLPWMSLVTGTSTPLFVLCWRVGEATRIRARPYRPYLQPSMRLEGRTTSWPVARLVVARRIHIFFPWHGPVVSCSYVLTASCSHGLTCGS